MLKSTCKLLGLWYDFLCYYCQRGGEVLLCDSASCSKIWHYNCVPDEFRPDNVAGAESEREKWLCPKCKNCKIERGENGASLDVQKYWIRRAYCWRVKAVISISMKIYQRIQQLLYNY